MISILRTVLTLRDKLSDAMGISTFLDLYEIKTWRLFPHTKCSHNTKWKISSDFLNVETNHNEFLAVFPCHKEKTCNTWPKFSTAPTISVLAIRGKDNF